jgi:hypothetical protein
MFTPQLKQRIIGSIFPGKLIFEDGKFRTALLNGVVAYIFLISGLFEGNKKGKNCFFDYPSLRVNSTDEISNSLIQDLQILSNLKSYLSTV